MKNSRKDEINFIKYLIIGIGLLVIGIILSISFGAAKIDLNVAWSAIFNFDSNIVEHQVIREVRLPRTIADIIVGSSFALSGAIMQGITRNPLADSGLLGINSGAGVALALCLAFLPGASYTTIIIFSFIGAGIGVLITYSVSTSRTGNVRPDKLILTGSSVSLLFLAISQLIAITCNIGQQLTYWNVGGVAGVGFNELVLVSPWFIIALLGAILLSPSITILNLGEEVAIGLGQKTSLIKSISIIIVLVLAAIAVSLVGPVGFVGLIIPHIVRFFIGSDYKFIIPCCAIYGGAFMVIADLVGRVINAPYETPLGIIFAIIGVPFFLYIAKKERIGI